MLKKSKASKQGVFLSLASILALIFSLMQPASIAAAGDSTLDRIGVQTGGAYQVTGDICVAVDLNQDGDVTQVEIDAAVEEDILDIVANATLIIALLVPGACDAFVPAPDADGGDSVDTIVDDVVDDQLDVVDDVVDAGVDDQLDVVDDVLDTGVDDEVDLIDGTDTDGVDTVVDDLIDDQLDAVDGVVDTGIDDTLDVVDGVVDTGVDDEIDLIDGADADGVDAADGTDAGDGTDGADGTDTGDGTDGADGTDAGDGADGTDAGDGADGTDAGDGAGGTDDGVAQSGTGGSSNVAQVSGLPSTGTGDSASAFVWPLLAAGSVLLILVGHFVLTTVKQRAK